MLDFLFPWRNYSEVGSIHRPPFTERNGAQPCRYLPPSKQIRMIPGNINLIWDESLHGWQGLLLTKSPVSLQPCQAFFYYYYYCTTHIQLQNICIKKMRINIFLQCQRVQVKYLFPEQLQDVIGNKKKKKDAHRRRMKVCFWWFQPPSLASRSTWLSAIAPQCDSYCSICAQQLLHMCPPLIRKEEKGKRVNKLSRHLDVIKRSRHTEPGPTKVLLKPFSHTNVIKLAQYHVSPERLFFVCFFSAPFNVIAPFALSEGMNLTRKTFLLVFRWRLPRCQSEIHNKLWLQLAQQNSFSIKH